MNAEGALQKLLKSYECYYNINTSDVDSPFSAEATFNSHNEQYFMVKAAKLADIDSNEFVFFYLQKHSDSESEELSDTEVERAAQIAWERGLSKVKPYYGHRNSDITVIFLSEKISGESFKKIKSLHLYKSYKLGLYGWSSLRALAYETSTGRAVTNRRGSDLKKLTASL